jgi:hypothetical protein
MADSQNLAAEYIAVRQISALHIAVASLLKEQQVKYNIF